MSSIRTLFVLIFLCSMGLARGQDYAVNSSCNTPYEDISGGSAGNNILADNELVSLPFLFNFNNTDYSEIRVSFNGAILFINGTGATPTLPSTNVNLPFNFNNLASNTSISTGLFPFWDELQGNGTNVRYSTKGSAPNRRFLVQWNRDINNGTCLDCTVKVQLVLYENGHHFAFVYDKTAVYDQGPILSTSAYGGTATIGYQKNANESYVYSFNEPKLFDTNTNTEIKCISFTRLNTFNSHTNFGVQSSIEDIADAWGVLNNPAALSSGANNIQKTELPFPITVSGKIYDSLEIKDGSFRLLDKVQGGTPYSNVFQSYDLYEWDATGGISYGQSTINGQNAFVVEWNNVLPSPDITKHPNTDFYNLNNTNKYTFQLQIFESGSIRYVYKDLYADSLPLNHISYGKNANISFNGHSIFNDEPAIQLDGNDMYAYILTIFQPTLNIANAPICPTSSITKANYYTSQENLVNNSLNLINLTTNTGIALSTASGSINITTAGSYRVSQYGEVLSSSHYTQTNSSIFLDSTLAAGYEHYLVSLDFYASTPSVTVTKLQEPSLDLSIENVTCPTDNFNLIVNTNNFITPSYLWEYGQTSQIIASTSITEYNVNVNETHIGCVFELQKIIDNTNTISRLFFAPISMSIDSFRLDSLLIYGSPYTLINPDSTHHIKEFIGTNINTATGRIYPSQFTTPGIYNVNVSIRTRNGCPALGSGTIEILKAPVIVGLDSIYCSDVNRTVRVQRERPPFRYSENQFIGNYAGDLVNLKLEITYYELEIEAYDLDRTTNPRDIINDFDDNDGQINLGQYGDSLRVVLKYYSRIKVKDSLTSVHYPHLTPNMRYLVAKKEMWVRKGQANARIISTVSRDSLAPALLCEYDLNHKINTFTTIQNGTKYVDIYELARSNSLGRITPQNNDEFYINPVLLDQMNNNTSNTNTTYKLIYTVSNNSCTARDSMFIFVPEPLDADFSHRLASDTIPSPNNIYCSNSEPIVLTPRITHPITSLTQSQTFFSVDYTPVFTGQIDVANLPNPYVNNVGLHTVTYQVTDIHGCRNSSTQILDLKPAPNPRIDVRYMSPKTWNCADSTNDFIQLNLKPSGFPITSISLEETSTLHGTVNVTNIINDPLYQTDSNAIHFSKSPDGFLNATHNIRDTVWYTFSITDGFGCTSSVTQHVNIYPQPEFLFDSLPRVVCQSPNLEFRLNPNPTTNTTIGATPANSNLDQSAGIAIYRPRDPVTDQIITYSHTDQYLCKVVKYDTITVTTDNTVMEWDTTHSLPPYVCNDDTTRILLIVKRPAYTSAPIGEPEFVSSSTLLNSNPLFDQSTFNYTYTRDSIYFRPSESSNGPIVITYSAYTQAGASACKKYLLDTINVHRPVPLTMNFGNPHHDSICEFDTTFIFISNFPQTDIPEEPQLINISSPDPISNDGIRQNTSIYYSFIPNAIDSLNAVSNPRLGWHVVKGEIYDNFGCYVSVERSIFVKENPKPKILYLDTTYCVGSPQSVITGNPTNGNWYNITTTDTDTITKKYALTPHLTPSIADTSAISMDSISSTEMNKIQNNFAGTYLFYHNIVSTNEIIYEVRNTSGCINRDTVITKVHSIPQLAIDPLGVNFLCSNEGTRLLSSHIDGQPAIPTDTVIFTDNIPNGILRDPITNEYLFNTMAIRPNDSLVRNIVASYRSPISGCVGRDTLPITIRRHPDANITNIIDGYCINGLQQTLLGENQDSSTNPVTITSAVFSSLYPNVITPIDNWSATIHPPQIQNGFDTITYAIEVSNGCRDTVKYHVLSYPVPLGVEIQMIDSIVCTNSPNIQIQGLPTNSGSSLGKIEVFRRNNLVNNIDSSNNSVLIVNVRDSAHLYTIGDYSVKYTYTDVHNCTDSVRVPMSVRPKPQAIFNQVSFCANDIVRVEDASIVPNALHASDYVNRWVWSYAGMTYPDTLNNFLEVSNTTAGRPMVSLIAITSVGCKDTTEHNIDIYNNPIVKFKGIGGCENEPIEFRTTITGLINVPLPGDSVRIDSLTDVVWDFGDNTIVNGSIANDTIEYISHAYATNGIYTPQLTVTNRNYCSTTAEIRLPVLPKYEPTALLPHLDDFEANDGGWIPDLTKSNDIVWQHGISNKDTLRSTSKVWVTDTTQPFPASSGSWIFTPCFDITQLDRPMVKFDLATDVNTYDGAVIQYFDANTEQWVSLGTTERGYNWYNTEALISLLTHDPNTNYDPTDINGWTGRIGTYTNNVTTPVSVRYKLDHLPNPENIRFRIAFTTFDLPENVGERKGVFVDNFFVGNRQRKVLVESISDITQDSLFQHAVHLKDLLFNRLYHKDVVLVDYHLNDRYYYQNTAHVNGRLPANAGVTRSTGNAFINKYKIKLARHITQQDLDREMLKDTRITVDTISQLFIYPDSFGIHFKATVKDTILRTNNDMLSQFIAVTENYIDWTSNGATIEQMGLFRNFNKEMPDLFPASLFPGDVIDKTVFWRRNVNSNIEDYDNINIVLFFQYKDTILQVERISNLNITNFPDLPSVGGNPVAIEELHEVGKEIFSMNLFPNPATTYTNLAFAEALTQDYEYIVYDIQGRIVRQGKIPTGTQQLEINTDEFASGSYIIKVKDQYNTVGATRKLIVVRP